MDKKHIDEWEQMESRFDFDEQFVKRNIKRSKGRKVWVNTVRIAFCSLVLVFILSNTSAVYVQAVQEIPLLNFVTKLLSIQPDVIANKDGYVQPLHIRYVDDNVSLYLQKMVIDEQSLYLYYYLHIFTNADGMEYQLSLLDDQEKLIDLYYKNMMGPDVIYCNHQLKGKEKITLRLLYDDQEINMDIPIVQDEISKKESFVINQKVKVNEQSITVERMDVFPLSARIYAKVDENNVYDVFNIDYEILVGGVGISSQNEENQFEDSYIVAVEPSPYFMEDEYEVYINTIQFVKEVHTARFNAATMELQSDEEMFEVIGVFKPGDTVFEEKVATRKNNKYTYIIQLRPTTKFEFVNNHSNYVMDGDCYWSISADNIISIFVTEENIKKQEFTEIEVKIVETIEVNEKLKLR